MTANEVNEIVVKLLAAADRVTDHDQRGDVLHYVGRLSRAATRERTAAVDETQSLRKKIVQQSGELMRLRDAIKAVPARSAAPVAQAQQPALAGAYGHFNEARLQAVFSSSTPALGHGAYGRLSRPAGLPEPKDKGKAMAATTEALVPYRSPSPVATSTNKSFGTTAQEHAGYGRVNTDRLLAIQAAPASHKLPKTSQNAGRVSLSDGPAPPAKKVTAANAEPIAPRDKQRIGSAAETTSARQATNLLLNELDQGVQAGQKRKACRSIDVPAHEEKREHPQAEAEQERPKKIQIKQEDESE